MNVLIIGGAGSLTNQMIKKLKKEGNRVHLLTGNRYADAGYESVFERYDLTYDSECLTDVFDSVNPDVTLFMGAFDSNFHWANEQRETVRFTSGLTNILMSYSMSGKGRFVYLTSDEVYSGNYEDDISEDEITTPATLKGIALAQGEDICRSFVRMRGYDIVVLRLDHLYKIPDNPKEVVEPLSAMCLEALRTHTIAASERESFSLLYEPDAVEFIYRVLRTENHGSPVYNLSSSAAATRLELAEMIRDAYGEDYPVAVEDTVSDYSRVVLSNRQYDGEFGIKIFADTKKNIETIVKTMLDRKEEFLTDEERPKSLRERILQAAGSFIRAAVPYLENVVFFFIFFLLNGLALKSQHFSRLDLYLLYVLLFAVVHGQQQATFAAIFSVCGYLFGQLGEKSLFDVVLDFNTYIWIAQLFIVGLVVGYMKDQIRKLRTESEEERQFLHRQLADIRDINGSNVRVKDALETQIVNQNDSIGKIYSITSKLERYTPEEVLFYAIEMVRDFLGSDDVAIYTVSNNYYARLFTFTSDRAKVLGKSIRYRELGELYETLSQKKVYINRNLDEKYPMMAVPIFEQDSVQTMIFAWGIPWERMTLGQADVMMVVSYLIQNAVLRATRYINNVESRRYQEGKLVIEPAEFAPLVRVFTEAKEKRLTECVLLRLGIPDDISAIVGAAPADIGDREVEITSDTRYVPLESRRKAKKSGYELLKEYLHLPSLFRKKARNAENDTRAFGASSPSLASVPVAIRGASYVSGSSSAEEGYEAAAKGLVGKIRNTDYVGVLGDGNLYVLLCNTSISEASLVIERIKGGGYECELAEEYEL